MDSIKAVLLHNGTVMSFHHRVTQSFTEFNQFEIKRIELRETLCYSVVKTHYYTVMRVVVPSLPSLPAWLTISLTSYLLARLHYLL